MYRKEAPPLGWKVRLLNRTIWDIGEFIFVEDRPETADAIMVVGGSYPELAETAADLWKKNFAARIFIGGGFSIKTGKFPGPLSKRDMYQRIMRPNTIFTRMCAFERRGWLRDFR